MSNELHTLPQKKLHTFPQRRYFTRNDATQTPHEQITISFRIIENRDETNTINIFTFEIVEKYSQNNDSYDDEKKLLKKKLSLFS